MGEKDGFPVQFPASRKWIFGDWTVSRDKNTFHVTHGNQTLDLLGHWFYMFISEYYQAYGDYLPPFSLAGKTVLDVGAGCGETAMFFLEKGASKVIAIERSSAAFGLLKANIRGNGWNAEAINADFSLSHLSDFKFDFMKMDIEGGERLLLGLPNLPCYSIIEVHSPKMTELFQSKFKADIIEQYGPKLAIVGVTPRAV